MYDRLIDYIYGAAVLIYPEPLDSKRQLQAPFLWIGAFIYWRYEDREILRRI